MNWKLKAIIQNAISLLPSSVSYEIYYLFQRRFGGLKRFNPVSRLAAAIDIWKLIQKQGYIPSGKVFFEVGTGRVPTVPMAYWLMGAEKTITVDLNPYLEAQLVREAVQYMSENEDDVLSLFGSLIDKARFDRLLSFGRGSPFSLPVFLDLCQVHYIAPGDASDTHLPDQSVDFHTSYTVFEHIPLEALRHILMEGNRIVTSNGLFIHRIDYSDHFSHSDKSISAINFLQYSDEAWNRYAGNKYMYMNRLRHDDFIKLFESAGHRILEVQLDIDHHIREMLRRGDLQLSERFIPKSEDILSITGAWIVSQKRDG